SVAGTLGATALALTANNIAVSGKVSDGGTGTTSLVAMTGTISETGTLVAGTLTGSAAGAASLTGASATANQIGTINGFSAATVTIRNGKALQINGLLNGNSNVQLTNAGVVTVGGTLAANTIGVTADGIALAGLITDGGSGSTSLISTTGTISGTGVLVAGTLSGSANGGLGLTGSNNRVAQISNYTAPRFVLADNSDLELSGTLSATRIAIDATGHTFTFDNG